MFPSSNPVFSNTRCDIENIENDLSVLSLISQNLEEVSEIDSSSRVKFFEMAQLKFHLLLKNFPRVLFMVMLKSEAIIWCPEQ